MDGGAWKAAVHGVAEGRTRLSDFTFTFHFHALEKEMATHSSVLAWRIPGTGEPGRLPSVGSHRVGHDWSDLAAAVEGWKKVTWQFGVLFVRHKALSYLNLRMFKWFLCFSSQLELPYWAPSTCCEYRITFSAIGRPFRVTVLRI